MATEIIIDGDGSLGFETIWLGEIKNDSWWGACDGHVCQANLDSERKENIHRLGSAIPEVVVRQEHQTDKHIQHPD